MRFLTKQTLWAAFLAAWLGGLTGCQSPYRLTVQDAVGRPNDKTRLTARLQLAGLPDIDTSVKNRDLSFTADDRFIGLQRTDDEGYATIRHRFSEPGVQRVQVHLDDPRRRWATGQGRVFVWGKNDPVLIVDIDGTICQTNRTALIFSAQDNVSTALPGAPDALEDLSRQFHIVYLTARPREYLDKTTQWLHGRGFPLGPVLTWDLEKHPWSAYDYKRKRIDDLQDDFKGVRIGIGNTQRDYEAYKKRKLFSILMEPGQPAGRLDRGVRLPNWESVVEFFRANPHLCDSKFNSQTPVTLP